jgi:hypothetical protein
VGKASRRKKQRNSPLGLDLRVSPEKISTRLAQLVDPHFAGDETRDSYAALIGLGAAAWQLSLVPAGERSEKVREFVRGATMIGLPLPEEWRDDLIDRKLRLFPSDERAIESWTVREEPDGTFTVIVAAYL